MLERQVAPAFTLFEAVDRCDVRMAERGQNARLALESLEVFGIGVNVVRKRLERHGAAEPGIVGEKDHTHSAAADLAVYLIGANGRAGGDWHEGATRGLERVARPAGRTSQTARV